MIFTLDQYKNLPVSEKIIVAHLEPGERLTGAWTVHSGSIYKMVADHYVIELYQNATLTWDPSTPQTVVEPTKLTSVASLAAVNGAGKWYFDPSIKTIYIWSIGSVDPASIYTFGIYRLFFSNLPADFPYDLDEGRVVPYTALIDSTSEFGAQLDDERKGTALESTGTISLFNAEGELSDIFDQYTWEGKRARIWALHRTLDLDDKILLFSGIIMNKQYSEYQIEFQLSDFNVKLREDLSLPRFTIDDFPDDSRLNTELRLPTEAAGAFKRRVYGRVDNMLIPSLERTEDKGINLSGTFSSGQTDVEIEVLTSQGGNGGQNEIQTITFDPTPNGGTFTLEFDGETTSPIGFNVSEAGLKAALELLGNIDEVTVIGNVSIGFSVEWTGPDGLADKVQMTAPAPGNNLYANSLQRIDALADTDVHSEISPGDELIAIGSDGTTTELTSTTIETLSRIDLQANTQMTVDFFDNTTYLQIEGVSSEFYTSELSVNDFIIIKGKNVNPLNRGVWKVSAIPAPGTINLIRAAGDGGSTETNVIINDTSGFDIVAVHGTDNQNIYLAGQLSGAFTEKTLYVVPQTPTPAKNRVFYLAHHELSQPTTTIDSIIAGDGVIVLDSNADMFVNDIIVCNANKELKISGVSADGQTIVVTKANPDDDSVITTLGSLSAGQAVYRPSVQALYHSKPSTESNSSKQPPGLPAAFRPYRDYSVSADSLGSYLTLTANAEKNIARSGLLPTTQKVLWTDDSRVVYSPSGGLVQFKQTEFISGSRDYLSPDGGTTWVQIEEVVDDQLAIMRTAWSGTTDYYETSFQKVEVIDDTSLISASVYGITDDGESTGTLLRTAADVVLHVIQEAEIEEIDLASFAQASEDSDLLVSLMLPLPGEQSPPMRRDLITLMNNTVFSSLYNNIDWNINYKILGPDRLVDNRVRITQEDVLKWSVNVNSDRIIRTIKANYRHGDIDRRNLQRPTASLVTYTNQNVVNQRITREPLEIDLYLYDENAAYHMARRYGLINATSQSTLTIATKLNTIEVSLNDLVEIHLDNMYSRYGASDSTVRIGLVNDIKKTETGVVLTIDDLGNIFNKVGTFQPDDVDYTNATEEQRLYGLWITDANGIVGNDPKTKGTNIGF